VHRECICFCHLTAYKDAKILFRFRWVALQLVELETCASLGELESQLNDLPGGLEETYDRILQKISPKHRADVKIFLQWLAFATRPLALAELAETVTIDMKSGHIPTYSFRNRYKDQHDVLVRCSSLIVQSQGGISIL